MKILNYLLYCLCVTCRSAPQPAAALGEKRGVVCWRVRGAVRHGERAGAFCAKRLEMRICFVQNLYNIPIINNFLRTCCARSASALSWRSVAAMGHTQAGRVLPQRWQGGCIAGHQSETACRFAGGLQGTKRHGSLPEPVQNTLPIMCVINITSWNNCFFVQYEMFLHARHAAEKEPGPEPAQGTRAAFLWAAARALGTEQGAAGNRLSWREPGKAGPTVGKREKGRRAKTFAAGIQP